ncbi:ATP-grasp domain-containing protein [Aeromicrobium sp.]|uniref:ATP-grasp domain-containing protein n=1 Tax=Aeromicrobium sp. TaxID=1871063 RepID=UPI003C349D46
MTECAHGRTFVTSSSTREFDPDLDLLVAAAPSRGLVAEITVWDDPAVTWEAYDAVVVRSCWDYLTRREEFLTWADSVPHLHSQSQVLRWNTDKIYLQQLKAAGVPIIQTRWDVRRGDNLGGHDEWVLKPTIFSGARDTARWESPEDVYEHSAALMAAGRTSMTQPFVESVDRRGETATLSFDNQLSHAIRKGPILTRGEGIHQERPGEESITPREPAPAQRAVSVAALEAVADILDLTEPPMYARVYLVTTDHGPVVIELELTEPSLFLPESRGGADRFVDRLLARI